MNFGAVPIESIRRPWPVEVPREPRPVERFPVRRLLVETTRSRGQATCGAYLVDGPDPETVRGRFLGRETPAGLKVPGPGPLLTVDEFVDDRLWPLSYKARLGLVGWDLPASLASVAFDSEPTAAGGTRLYVFGRHDAEGVGCRSRYRPSVELRPLANGIVSMSLGPRKDPDPGDIHHGHGWRGRFLDLRDLATRLSGERPDDLRDACLLFECEVVPPAGPPTPETASLRLDAMAELLHALEVEAASWPGAPYLALDKGGTSAALPVAILQAARVPQPLRRRGGATMRVSRRCIGAGAETASIGARSETRVRMQWVHGHDFDLVAEYANADRLAGVERFLTREVTAHHLTGRRSLDRLRGRVEDFLAADPLDHPEQWSEVAFLARARPNGELWTVHVGDGEFEATATVPVVAGSESWWTTSYDLTAAGLPTGACPDLDEAWVFTFGRRLRGLRPVPLFGGRYTFDPRRDGISRDGAAFGNLGLAFARIREDAKHDPALSPAARLRRRGALKTADAAASFGLYLATTPVSSRRAAGATHRVLTADDARKVGGTPERPGPFAFPPAAALVQGAGRLLLALLIRECEAAGMEVVATDTDGLFAVEGGAS